MDMNQFEAEDGDDNVDEFTDSRLEDIYERIRKKLIKRTKITK